MPTGKADLAVHQISEILPAKGVELAGPLPEATQNYATYAAAGGGHTAHAEAAREFLATLSGPEATEMLRKGMTPAN